MVLSKCTEMPYNLPKYLLMAPPLYLKRCLEAGMDPNQWKHLGLNFLETAARKCKIKHVEELLKCNETRLSPKAAKFVLKNKHMKKFLPLLFEKGLPCTPLYVIQALQRNDSELLKGALISLQKNDPQKQWQNIAETLTCPILNYPTTNLVQTPQGQLYDGPALLQWIESNETDPLTRQRLVPGDLRNRDEILPEIIGAIRQLNT